jgi:hypothetical protein
MSVPDLYWIKVDGEEVQTVRLGSVPYIQMTKRPLFTWSSHDADGDPLTFNIKCYWHGRRDVSGYPTISPVEIFSRSGLSLEQYRPKEDESLSYLDSDDVGGDYYVELTATDNEEPPNSIEINGWFRVNQPPLVPTGLRVL